MTLYNLIPRDSRVFDWLFWDDDDDGPRRPKGIYADLRCRRCGKLDEVAAISRGIDPSLTIQSGRDFIGTMDGMKVGGKRAKEAFEEEGIRGIRYIPLPGHNHWVLWPEVRVRTDLNLAGFQLEGRKCGLCGRYPEVLVGPLWPSLDVPEDPMVVFASEVWNEDPIGRVLWLFAQEPVAKALKKRRLSGLEINPAY